MNAGHAPPHYRAVWFDAYVNEVVDILERSRRLGLEPTDLLRAATHRFEQRYDETALLELKLRGKLVEEADAELQCER